MRGVVVVAALASACAPSIVSGAYDCGPEQLCPPDQACDGPTNSCVTKGVQKAFACDPAVLHEPDDTPAGATALPVLHCVTAPLDQQGCLAAADSANWYAFTTPAGCASLEVDVVVTYPLAFEKVDIELWQGTTMIAPSGACSGPISSAGSEARCIAIRTLAESTTYGVLVKPAGGDCNGACNFNRYDLSIQAASVH